MDDSHVACFLELAAHLNFAHAAHALGITQPTVSKRIKSLESELGSPLFDRTTRSVSLSPAGRALLPIAREISHLVRDAHNIPADNRDERGRTFTVGYTDPFELPQLAAPLRQVIDPDDAHCARVRHMTLDAGINAVRTGRAAVMMGIDTVSLRDDEMRFAGLAPVSLICVASTSLDLQMEIKTTGRFSMARIPLNEFSRKHRIICVSDGPDKVPSPRMYGDLIIPSLSMSSAIFCNSVAEAYALARAHVGVAAVPDFAMLPEPGLRFFDIEESPASVYGAYYRSHDIHARKYVEFAQAAYAS